MARKDSAVLRSGLDRQLTNIIFDTRVQNKSTCVPVNVYPYYLTVNIWLADRFLAMPYLSSTDVSRILSICLGIVMHTLPFVP